MAFTKTVTATGGTAPYKYSADSLPPGLTIAADTGILSGAATVAGDFNLNLTVADSAKSAVTTSKLYALKVFPAVSYLTTSLPGATAGSSYAGKVETLGGKAPITLTVAGLPAELAFEPATGSITGKAADAGTIPLAFTAKDSNGATALKSFDLVVAAPIVISTATLPNGNVGTLYPQAILQASGGLPPLVFSVAGGDVPPGLTVSATGTVAGTPTFAGSFTFTIAVTDANKAVVSKPFTLAIYAGAPPRVVTATLPNAVEGKPYSQTLTGSDGELPYTWSISTGALPAGLALANGVISGTATSSGTTQFQVQLTDGNGQLAKKNLSLSVFPELKIGTTSLAEGYVSEAYAVTLAATGGQAPYSWSVGGGAPPPGITLNAGSGILSGTASTAGSSGVTLSVTDVSGQTPSAPFTLTIYALPTIATATLADGSVGAPFSQLLQAAGGKAPYTFTVSAGVLPAGLALTNGAITGTPTAAGSTTFTLQVADANGKLATRTFTLAVFTGLAITTGTLPDAYTGQTYSQIVGATGGSTPYAWTISAGGEGSVPMALNFI